MTRLQQLERLIEARCRGSSRELARKIERSDAQVYQLRQGLREIGDGTARRIETSFGLPGGWLDSEDQVPSDTITPYTAAKPAPKLAQDTPAAYASARYECHKIIDGLPAEACERLLPVLQMLAKGDKKPAEAG